MRAATNRAAANSGPGAGGHPAAGVEPGRGRRGRHRRLPVGPRRGPRAAPPVRAGPGPGRASRWRRSRPWPATTQAVHDLLQRISVQVTRYAGLVEAARATNKAGGAEADGYLVDSRAPGRPVVQGDVTALTAATQATAAPATRTGARRAGRRPGRGRWSALAVLGFGQAQRGQDEPAASSTCPWSLATLPCWWSPWRGWCGPARRAGAPSTTPAARATTPSPSPPSCGTRRLRGQGGRDAGPDHRRRRPAGRRRRPVGAGGRRPGHARRGADAIRAGTAAGAPGGLLGQAAAGGRPPRERAAVAEAAVRWQRYRDTVAALRRHRRRPRPGPSPSGRPTPTSTASTSRCEAVLGQNRGQFLDGLDDGRRPHVERPRPRPCSCSSAPWWPCSGASSCASTTTGERRPCHI